MSELNVQYDLIIAVGIVPAVSVPLQAYAVVPIPPGLRKPTSLDRPI